MASSSRPRSAAPLPAPAPTRPVLRLASQDLFRTAREIEIEHAGRIYTLRLTQSNKLILTA